MWLPERLARCTLAGMRAYSVDLRERALAAVDGGTELADVASTLRVSQPHQAMGSTSSCWTTLAGGTGPYRPAGVPDTRLAALSSQLETSQPDNRYPARALILPEAAVSLARAR